MVIYFAGRDSMKTGVIDIGGGMRGIYAAGVFDGFIDFKIHFDYCIGVSAGTANIVSFLAGQRGRNYRFYIRHAQDRRYMSLDNMIRRGEYFNLSYIYETLTNHVDPLNYDALIASDSEMKIVVTNAKTAQPEYFDKKVFSERNCRAIMASCALPIACRAVEIDGNEYFDGGVADPIPIKKALEDGCDRVVVLMPRNIALRKKPEILKPVYYRVLKDYPELIETINNRHEIYNRSIDELLELKEQGRALIICPAININARITSKNAILLDRRYKLGRQDAVKSLPALREWGLL